MNQALERAPQQERASSAEQLQARFEAINASRENIGRLKKGGDTTEYVGQLTAVKEEYQALGRELTQVMQQEGISQKDLTTLKKLRETARKQADKLSARMRKVEGKRQTSKDDDEANQERLQALGSKNVYSANDISFLLESELKGRGVEELETTEEISAATARISQSQTALKRSISRLLEDRTLLEGKKGRSAEETTTLNATRNALAHVGKLQDIYAAQNKKLAQKQEELAQAAQAAENQRAAAKAAAVQAAREAGDAALQRSAEERGQIATQAAKESWESGKRATAYSPESTASSEQQIEAQKTRLRERLTATKKALRNAERRLADAKRDRSLLGDIERPTAYDRENIISLNNDIDRAQEDIANAEETIEATEQALSTLEVYGQTAKENARRRLQEAEETARFALNPDAEQQATYEKLVSDRAALAAARERLSAAQKDAEAQQGRTRDAIASHYGKERQDAVLRRRLTGDSSAVDAFEQKVNERAAVGRDIQTSERLAREENELTAQEAAIDEQIRQLESGAISSETLKSEYRQELRGIREYLDIDETGLRTIYAFMKMVEEDTDNKIIGVLPTDVASHIAGKSWNELAKELSGAVTSQKAGFMSRVWRRAFGDPNAQLKEALQAVAQLNPAELRRAADLPVDHEGVRRQQRYSSRMRERSSSLSQTYNGPFSARF